MSIKTLTATVDGVAHSMSFPITLLATPPRSPVPFTPPKRSKTYSPLLDLPAEIRLKIYALAVMLDSDRPSKKAYPKPQNLIGRLASPDLLLTCRQIYYEARFLPFQVNTFDFVTFYGSNLHTARQFLQQLERWQVEEIRDLHLSVVERDVKNWGTDYAFLDVCDMLSFGLRTLKLDLQGTFENPHWLEPSAPWIADGISRMKSLRRLEMVVSDKSIEIGGLAQFENTLRQAMGWVKEIEVRKASETEKVDAQREQMIQMMRSTGIVGPTLNLGMLMTQ